MALTHRGKLGREFEHLAEHLAIANTHIYLFRKLREAQAGELQDEFYKARDFWGFTMRAHIQNAFVHLCRVYDRSGSGAFHLLRFVQRIRSLAGTKLTKAENKKLEEDLHYLDSGAEVTKLRRLRNNLFAHQNHQLILEGRDDFLKQLQCELNLDQIQSLVDYGFSLLKRWAHYYKPSDFVPKGTYLITEWSSGKNDYLVVLDAIRLKDHRRKRTP